jgi:hypothetical protein
MSLFKDHKISVSQLLGVIPKVLLFKLITTTKVDDFDMVFTPKNGYVLPFGIVESVKLSQLTLVDTLNGFLFKTLFD